jgi:hypothetical protein
MYQKEPHNATKPLVSARPESMTLRPVDLDFLLSSLQMRISRQVIRGAALFLKE